MATLPTDPATAAPGGNKPGLSPHLRATPRRWPSQPWWLVFLVLMAVNYLATRVFFREPSSITVPYTFFKAQVDAAKKALATYDVKGVPTFIIDGKYQTSARMAGGTKEMLRVVEYLVERAASERPKQ